MILYKTDEKSGWYGTQAEAKASGRPFEKREVPTDKPGLLRFLNYSWRFEDDEVTKPVTPTVQPDDNFEDLPLAQQLHLACLALENARTTLKGDKT